MSHIDNEDSIAGCPTLFQQYIDKSLDVRLTVLDGRSVGVALVARDDAGNQLCDIRRNNMDSVQYDFIAVPNEILAAVRGMLQRYSLRFGAFDFVVDKAGIWYFLEVNPNGQWAWLDQVADAGISALFVDAFQAHS
jgi:D-alanine-D-alanine ligase-like ATP-grasp enzyme